MSSFFRRRAKQRNDDSVDPLADREDINAVLEQTRKHLLDADPETEPQWRVFQSAVHLAGSKARAHQPLIGTRLRWVGATLAASAIALAIVLVLWPHGEVPQNYQTARGQITAITLGDGTEVILNHTSSLTLDGHSFNSDRRVHLAGEAFFKVQKNGAPFTVATAVGEIHVLGTEFDVRDRDGQLAVGVVTGTVNVSSKRGEKDSAVTIIAGELTVCASSGYPQQPIHFSAFQYPGWMYGKMSFFRTSIASVCDEIEAKFNVTIRIESPGLGDRTVTGELNAGSATGALATLAQLTGTHYRNENGTYTLY